MRETLTTLARALLQKTGLVVVTAENGLQAVELACAEAGSELAAILMDLQMPEMDGSEATRTILSRLGARAPPLSAMTAHAMNDERDHCLAAGMVAHLTKPIDVHMLDEVLGQWIASGVAAAERQGGAPRVELR
jgi:CheY-like chemotaxis protein